MQNAQHTEAMSPTDIVVEPFDVPASTRLDDPEETVTEGQTGKVVNKAVAKTRYLIETYKDVPDDDREQFNQKQMIISEKHNMWLVLWFRLQKSHKISTPSSGTEPTPESSSDAASSSKMAS